jgi:hypothetical protein
MQEVVVRLVKQLTGATELETPPWISAPSRSRSCNVWGVFEEIYGDLVGMELPTDPPPREFRRLDAVLSRPGATFVLEFDETQHFNAFRATTLERYPAHVVLGFPLMAWKQRCRAKAGLEGGGFGAPRPPLFPGPNGRHRQRAFRDSVADLLPSCHGYGPTLRVGYFEVDEWIFGPRAREKMSALLIDRAHECYRPVAP